MMKLDFSGLESSMSLYGGGSNELSDGFTDAVSFDLPVTSDFDGWQKKSIQMVKPAKGTTTLAFIFKDAWDCSAWDCSAWVHTYGLFLEERLECFRGSKYDIEAERIPRPAQGQENKGYSKTRDVESEELLEQLPSLQQLLYRVMGCRESSPL